MTFPAFRHLLALEPALLFPNERSPRTVTPLAVGAWRDSRPAALALGVVAHDGGAEPELLSIYVAQPLRGRGIGTRLVSEFERTLEEAGCGAVSAVYMTGRPGTAMFEHTAAKLGWETPITRTVTVKFTFEEVRRTDWFRGDYRPRTGVELFAWKDLTRAEDEALRESQRREPWIPFDLIPWEYAECEPRSSLGARFEGSVVGWMVNHAIGSDTIRFTCAFMRPDVARLGSLVALMTESVRRLEGTRYSRGTFVTPVEHRPMVRFIRRRCAPWFSFCGETRGTRKALRQAARIS